MAPEYYYYERIDMECTRINDINQQIRDHLLDIDVISDELHKEIEDASLNLMQAVLRLRRAEGKLKEYNL